MREQFQTWWRFSRYVRPAVTVFWDPRWFFATLLLLFALIGQLFLGFFTDWRQALLAIATSVITELILGRLVTKKWVHPVSATMTGISVSILLTTPRDTYWPYVVASALGIGSKYLFRHQGNHIFNPSNFAVSVLFLFLPRYNVTNPSQWTNSVWPLLGITALGLIVALRAKRMDAAVSFIATFVSFAFIRAWIQGLPLWWALGPALGAEFHLFTFFMLTDPKTTPRNSRHRIYYGIIIGVLDAFLRMLRISYSPFYALITVCALVPLLNRRSVVVPARSQI